MIHCRTLGPVAVTVDGGEPPAELLWRKHLALLVYLARSPHRARTREHLIGVLWGDRPEPAARHSLREAVHVLRGAAGEEWVDTAGEQVRLADAAVELDVDRLEALAASGDWAGRRRSRPASSWRDSASPMPRSSRTGSVPSARRGGAARWKSW